MKKNRKLSLFAVLTLVLSALGLLFLGQGTAQAHGVAMMPGSRTYLCYEDALGSNGALNPTNAACAAAIAQSGSTSLYNWFAVLDSNAGGRGQGYVPDGTICSAGNKSPYDFSGYNLARDDWPRTHLTSGSTMQLQYSNWAAHPGTFRVYLTKQGWSPTTPLAWADLEQIGSATNPPAVGSPGTTGGHYYWDQALPSNRSGNAMMFIQWVRSDSNENFFSCSDITFDGGHGEVTGIHNSGSTTGGTTTSGSTTGGTTTSGSTTGGTTTGGTTTGGTTTGGTTTGGTTTGGTTDGGTTGGTDTGSCMAMYAITSAWSGGFQGEVTVMNHGTSPSSHWKTTWTLGTGTQINSVWNGAQSISGGVITVTNAAYNGTIPPGGASTTFGFTANSTGNNLPAGSISCTFA
ncbi:lytic polysaccharide monooxygenase [Streptomyces sp. NBC_01190]|uniref:lytic polysaccharide monooxygenase n=1 Tax=Streptomyces sp. NBC_01190 TaxID=2903767 RepID=UPI00386FC753|nr:lytic polysaccharide monooxygenase [Streptomyces sp. NBC_01190]